MKVSVIIPVHNTEKYLSACLNSVLNQTEQNIEVIAVNDHSADRSFEILKYFEKLYPHKMKVINMKDKYGVSAARNEGLKVAQGRYIGFVDSDDVISLNMFQDFYQSAQNAQVDIVIGNCLEVSNSSDILHKPFVSSNETPSKTIYSQEKRKIFCESPAVWDKLFSHDFLGNYSFLENCIYEDHGFTYPLLLKANAVVSYKRFDYLYRRTIGSIMHTTHQIRPDILDIIEVCNYGMQNARDWNLNNEALENLEVIYKDSILRRVSFLKKWNICEQEKKALISKMLSIANVYYPDIIEGKDEYANYGLNTILPNQIEFKKENLRRSIVKIARKN